MGNAGKRSGLPGWRPPQQDVPVFSSYRMDHQFDVIRLVGENDRRPGSSGAVA